MTKRLRFVVEIDRPEDATISDLKSYIEDAVGSWCSQFEPPNDLDPTSPGHPLWNIGSTVAVYRLTDLKLRKLAKDPSMTERSRLPRAIAALRRLSETLALSDAEDCIDVRRLRERLADAALRVASIALELELCASVDEKQSW